VKKDSTRAREDKDDLLFKQRTILVCASAFLAISNLSANGAEFCFIISLLLFLVGGVLTVKILYFKPDSVEERMALMKVRSISKSEVEGVYEVLSRYSGGFVIPKDRQQFVYSKCRDSFVCIREGNHFDLLCKTVGIVILYPLNKAGVDLLNTSGMAGGNIEGKHIAKRHPRGCHIAFVWGESLRVQGKALAIVNNIIVKWSSNKSSFRVFTKPTTQQAFRAIKKQKFIAREEGKSGLGNFYFKDLQ